MHVPIKTTILRTLGGGWNACGFAMTDAGPTWDSLSVRGNDCQLSDFWNARLGSTLEVFAGVISRPLSLLKLEVRISKMDFVL
jgi:hypothetical protein